MKALLLLSMLAIIGSIYCKPSMPLPLSRVPFNLEQVEQQTFAKVNGVKKWLGVAGCALQNIFGNNRGSGGSTSGRRNGNFLKNALQNVISCIPDSSEEVDVMNNQQVTKQTLLAEASGLSDFLGVTGCALQNIFGENGYLDEEVTIERKRKYYPSMPPRKPTNFNLKNVLLGVARCLPSSGIENADEEALNKLAVEVLTQELEEEEMAEEEEAKEDEEMAEEEENKDDEEMAEEQFLPAFLVKALGSYALSKFAQKFGG